MSLFRGEEPALHNLQTRPTSTGDIALLVQARDSGQTAKLVSVKNAAGTEVASIDNAGALVAGTFAPTDNVTIASAKTLAVTTADKLTVGGVIIPQTLTVVFQAPIATAAVSQTIFTADKAYQVTAVSEVHGTASSSGTLNIEKLTGTTAPGSGTAMLTGTVSTAGTANTVLPGTLTGTVGTLQLAAGDRIGFVSGGSQTNLVGMNVVVSLKRI